MDHSGRIRRFAARQEIVDTLDFGDAWLLDRALRELCYPVDIHRRASGDLSVSQGRRLEIPISTTKQCFLNHRRIVAHYNTEKQPVTTPLPQACAQWNPRQTQSPLLKTPSAPMWTPSSKRVA